jgi:hypothetical protein
LRNSRTAIATCVMSVLCASCQGERQPVHEVSFTKVREMSGGPQIPFPTTSCGTFAGPTTVLKIVIPKDFLQKGLTAKVNRKQYDEQHNTESGNPISVDPTSNSYPTPHTRVDFDAQKLFAALPSVNIVAVKIINKHASLYFDPNGAVTVSDDYKGSDSAHPKDLIFCGLKTVTKESDPDDTDNTPREVVKFYVIKSSNSANSYGYNIHLMIPDGMGDTQYDVPIAIDPKVTNYG